jgi:hypothetical protein
MGATVRAQSSLLAGSDGGSSAKKTAFFSTRKMKRFSLLATVVSANETGLAGGWIQYRLSRFLFEK